MIVSSEVKSIKFRGYPQGGAIDLLAQAFYNWLISYIQLAKFIIHFSHTISLSHKVTCGIFGLISPTMTTLKLYEQTQSVFYNTS